MDDFDYDSPTEAADDMYSFDADAYRAAASNCFLVPSYAATRSVKGGQSSRWTELFNVRKLSFEPTKINNAEPGDTCAMITIEMQVDPESHDPETGEESINKDRMYFARLNFNFSAFARDAGGQKGHPAMTRMSIEALTSFIAAAGYSADEGVHAQQFVIDRGADIVGAKLWGVVLQKPNKQGDIEDSVRRFAEVTDTQPA